ncbi:hypothetical protein DdX_18328 [Ditylenchus destructor]|uniref:HAT C-terminal dimerisation domain-containing protein n=1 Tax=Ditylenchus destructor TaxID=166010 RepID=A0AAD4MPR0_9BILA|nr:hypothetical protein DdX_18328 [Ditylenchus destructor]
MDHDYCFQIPECQDRQIAPVTSKKRRSAQKFDKEIHTTNPWDGSKDFRHFFDSLLENGQETDYVIYSQQNPYINSLSQATQHAFIKKIGDLSDPEWLKITHFNVNVAVTAAFLDPLAHSQLPYLCDIIPAFDYEQMKEIVHKVARPFISQRPPNTSTKKSMFPQKNTIEWVYKPIDDELSMYINMRKHTDDALEFWKDNQTALPILTKTAKIYLGIEASSSPSERSFKELSKEKLCLVLFG